METAPEALGITLRIAQLGLSETCARQLELCAHQFKDVNSLIEMVSGLG